MDQFHKKKKAKILRKNTFKQIFSKIHQKKKILRVFGKIFKVIVPLINFLQFVYIFIFKL